MLCPVLSPKNLQEAYIRKTPTTPQHLVIHEAEAEMVRQIYRWCVEEHLSSYAIHRRLTA